MENSPAPTVASFSSSSSVLEEHPQEFDELLASLPKEKPIVRDSVIALFQDVWCHTRILRNVISFQNHFQAHDQDIIIASTPKSGITWLKAILFSIVNRGQFPLSNSPLLIKFPHELVPTLEFKVYANNDTPDLISMCTPRLFSTHVPCVSLPKSLKESKCKIVCVCRNPFDNLVSLWHFGSQTSNFGSLGWTLEEFVEKFCEGKIAFGPFWNHVLDYWKESIENPDKVLFLKYKDLKEDATYQMKRLAEFIGFPFSPGELRQGVVEDISKLCSLNVLRDLEVNRNGKRDSFPNSIYFRKGEVGDWANHLTPSMFECLNKMIEEKVNNSGLSFKVSL